jgi:putative membrane protein
MHIKSSTSFVLSLAMFLFAAAAIKGSTVVRPTPADEEFANEAAKGGKMEVELGRLASKRGRNVAVRQFGQRMVRDHTRAGNELKKLATSKGIILQDEMDAEGQAAMTRLSGLRGAAFDRAYMEMMVDDHEKDVAAFQTEATSGTDADFKAFAARTLPTLQTHLRLAKQAAAKVK